MPIPFLVWAAGAAIVALAATVYFWDAIADALESWLKENNLTESNLFSSFIVIDKAVRSFRVRLRVKKTRFRAINVKEFEIDEDRLQEIAESDPGLYNTLMKHGRARKDLI